MVTKVERWQAADGDEFDSEEAARRHETTMEKVRQLDDWLSYCRWVSEGTNTHQLAKELLGAFNIERRA